MKNPMFHLLHCLSLKISSFYCFFSICTFRRSVHSLLRFQSTSGEVEKETGKKRKHRRWRWELESLLFTKRWLLHLHPVGRLQSLVVVLMVEAPCWSSMLQFDWWSFLRCLGVTVLTPDCSAWHFAFWGILDGFNVEWWLVVMDLMKWRKWGLEVAGTEWVLWIEEWN